MKDYSFFGIVKSRLKNILDAFIMLKNHRRTFLFLLRKKKFKKLQNMIFTILFIRGEESGRGLADPLFKFFPTLAPNPWGIEFEITTKCYLRCLICERNYWKNTAIKNKDMSFADFKKIIDRLPGLKWINLTGEGSPFLNPDFVKMLTYLTQKNINTVFFHDFFYMTEELAVKLISLGIDKIWISLDGATAQTYNQIRLGSDFNKVIQNIKLFLSVKGKIGSPIPEIGFRFAYSSLNYKEIPRFVQLIASLSQDKILGDEVCIGFIGLLEFEENKNWLLKELPQRIIEQAVRLAQKENIKLIWAFHSPLEEQKAPLEYCIYWTEPYVAIDGSVLSDCAVMMSNNRDFLRKNCFGNALKTPFDKIWYSKRYRQFRKLVVNPKGPVPILCQGCRSFNTKTREKLYGISKRV